jgi:hypothetical protein
MARPQAGVDALAGKLPQAKGAPAGVSDSGDATVGAVPTVTLKAP